MFHRKKIVWLLLLPGLAGLLLFYIGPFIGGITFSLRDGTFANNCVGLQNYVNMFTNKPIFLTSLKNTWEISLLCAPVIWLLSFLLAAMLKRIGEKLSTPYRNVLLMPYLMPSSAVLLIWVSAFDYNGVINRLLALAGVERVLWLQDQLRVPIILMYIWKNLGFSVVLFASALTSVHPSLYEYAELEGAGWWRQTFRITLPQILPTAFLVFVLAWVNAFKIFKEAYFIGGAHPSTESGIYTLMTFMYNMFKTVNYQDVTTAAYIFALTDIILFAVMYSFRAVRAPEKT